jgi:Protein of unknown function (DUF4058)
MPLHDWSRVSGWENVHILWMTELFHSIRPRLPEGFRAYLGTSPVLAINAQGGKPDLAIQSWPREGSITATDPSLTQGEAPDIEVEVEVATIDPGVSLLIERHGALVAAVELISPRNKDRPSARDVYRNRYLGYLLNGANLVLIDVHPRPSGFSFADRIAAELSLDRPPCSAPMAASYRVGEAALTGGRFVAIWTRVMTVGEPLPSIPLPLTVDLAVTLDLEQTYARAAEDSYL